MEHNDQGPVPQHAPETSGIPDWLLTFMRNQEQTNRRLETGISQLQAAATRGNDSPSPATVPQTDTTPSKTVTTGLDDDLRKPKHSHPHPEKFTGEDETMFPQFKGLLEAKLEIDRKAIGTEKECIWYAFGRLSGKAAGRIYPWMESTKSTDLFTVDEFMKQLDAAFADPQKRQKALSKINQIRQGNREFREFLRDFEQTMLEAHGWKWDDQVRKGYLKAAINRELRDRLVTQEEPVLYSDYVGQLRRISDNLQEIKAWDARRNRITRPGNHLNTPPQPLTRPATDEMDWEPTRTVAAALTKQPQQRRRAPRSSDAERQKRREDGACVRCGSMEHWVANCPFDAAVSATTHGPSENRSPARKPQVAAAKGPKPKPTTPEETVEEVEWETEDESGKE
jgi:hypothetical protein